MLSNKLIKIFNITLVLLSVFLLIKTSTASFVFSLSNISIAESIFIILPYGNTEVSSLSASVLAAYIFYFINTYLPELRRKKNQNEYIKPRVIKIITNVASIFRTVNEQSSNPIVFPLSSYEEIRSSFETIKFGDIYTGSSTLEIDNGHHKIVDREIEYHVLRSTNECINNINRLRLANTLLDEILLSKLDKLEDDLKLALQALELMSNVKKKRNGFDQAMIPYEWVYKSAKELMFYFKNNISSELIDADIWFNPSTRNFERKENA